MKALPHSQEFERAALAAALLSEDAMHTLLEVLEPQDLYFPAHRAVYSSIKELYRKGKPVDIVHLMAESKDPEIRIIVTELFGETPTARGIGPHCAKILELSERRRAIDALQKSLDDLFDDEVEDPLQKAQARLFAVTKPKGNQSCELASLVEDAYGRTAEAYQARLRGEHISAAHVSTGLPDMDEALTMKRGDMVVIGARPSAGKTSVGLQIALNAAREKPVLFFSLEEPGNQIADRYLTAMTGINMRRIQEGRLSADEMSKVADAQATVDYVNLVVNDTPGLRVSDMRSIALRLQSQRNQEWGAIMIDHMIKVRGENPSSVGHQKLTQVSQDIKNMARTLRIPVIALTQLRRPQDEDAEPNMSDLRESGSIEEDADSILLIHRPERDKGYSVAKFLLKKQRTGPCGTFEYIFEADKMRFIPASKKMWG
jgi:replicative DNA helicase